MSLQSLTDLDEPTRALVQASADVAERAHAPYSGFGVGAALRCASGAVVVGCNVENASYGLTICAERNAVTTAIAEGWTDYAELAIWTPTDEPSVPCGACRQFLAEFAPSLVLWIGCRGGVVRRTTLAELYPEPFRFDARGK